MNILSALFGIFRKRGLVTSLKEGKSLGGFFVVATLFSILGGALYGYATGIGIGVDVAIKDAIKVGLMAGLGLLFSIPVFWVAYRLLGREESLSQVAAIPTTLMATVAIILMVSAPVVFMLSVMSGVSENAIYIHVVIVDLAVLVGLYLGGTLAAQSFDDKKKLVIPNAVGFMMMGVILVVLINFMAPFLSPYAGFSVGVDRLRHGLGIGVAEIVTDSLESANSGEQIRYQYQRKNKNGEVEQEYTINRTGEDYLIEVILHAISGETILRNRNIWILDGEYFTDFDEGFVTQVEAASLASILDTALQPAVF